MPVASPKPMRGPSWPPHQPRSVTVSPSSRNVRVVPSGSSSGSAPRHVSSTRLPRSGFVGPLDGARSEQVAGAGRRAVHRHVGELLGERPVHVREVRRRDHLSVELDGEVEVEPPRQRGPQVRVGLGILLGRLDEVRAQRVERDDPRRDRRGEALREVRAERLVLVALDVARRPVVEQHDAEDVAVGVVGQRCARSADRRRGSRPRARCRGHRSA